MGDRTILVLGGYGGVGKVLCRRLLEETDVNLVIAGPHLEKAEELKDRLNSEFKGKRVSSTFANASDEPSLITAFQHVTMVIDASIAVQHVAKTASAVLKSNADYLDFHFEQNVVTILNQLSPEIVSANRCFITQAGFHPGLPSAFVRYAASSYDNYTKAIIGMAMNQRVEKPESIYELVDMLSDFKVEIYKDSKWRYARTDDFKKIDFGPRFGRLTCFPLQMAEMRAIPEMLGLRETGVYVAGFNWFVDYLVFPTIVVFSHIKKGWGRDFFARLLLWGMNTFTKAEKGVSFVLESEGIKAGKTTRSRIVAEHDDAYEFTAIPVVACILQYLDGSIAKPGLHMMGHMVEPIRLLKDMRRMGISINL